MSDNTTLPTMAGGDVIATDDIGGIKFQRVKNTFGVDGVAVDVSTTNPLPCTTDNQRKSTYTATVARLSTGALTANTLKQFLSFEHSAGATKTMRLRALIISGYATSTTAGTVEFQLLRGTAASSGGTTVTPVACHSADGAAETVVKSLPTIVAATVIYTGNAMSVTTTANTYFGIATNIIPPMEDGAKSIALAAAALQGLVLSVISTAAITLTMNVTAIFTEE
jgi:hypothetical protein